MTGVATAALGAVVVAGAGPALAQTTLTQGSAITAPAGACSLTIVDEATAYTAAHCGAGQWQIGSTVRDVDGAAIGTVSALPGDSGVDAVRVALADDVDVVGDWSTRPASSVGVGETVYTHGSSVPLGAPNTVSHTQTFEAATVCDDAYADQVALDTASTHAGDSGGAVYDAQQRVVGVISGIAPVTFDAEGNVVGCDAQAMSSIMVPVESLDALDASAAPAAETAPAIADVAGPVADEDLPTGGEPAVDESELTEFTPAEEEAIAAELKARAEAAAEEEAAEAAPAAEAPAAEAAAPGVTDVVAAPAEGVAYGTRVVAQTDQGGFASVTVTAYDADGTVLGQDGLDLTGEYRAWLPVPAEVPAGGSVVVTVVDAAGAATDATVTLDGQLVG
ncbi:trypsin-like serine protease [Micrococcus luteus]|nr:trypsin-like serine protease [Micrococcus luteus]MBN6846030.1 trypsin-like serine protease [Micrococcus luteus]MBN6862231.1 trypsin-like serine protease [Micrococcus luteus]MBN6864195.1 trypsin-like serine protease [Micrococcus luteus]MBY0208457.1 trypsin-like serine protease [Micrococcus luteus]